VEGTIIAGFGNILLSDEGIGVHIVKNLKKNNFFPGSEYLDLGTSSYQLANYMNADVRKIILIDCINKSASDPGLVVRLHMDDIVSETDFKLSLHQIKLIDTLILISLEYDFPEVLIIGIVPHDTETYLTNMSRELQNQFDVILKTVSRYISEFLGTSDFSLPTK